MRNCLLPLVCLCVLISSCGIRHSKLVTDPYYRNTSISEADNHKVSANQHTLNSQECNLNFMANECTTEEKIIQLTSTSEKFKPVRIPKTLNNHILDPQKSSKIKSNHSKIQNEFIDYEGNNNAMEWGFKLFIYGLLTALSIIGLGYIFPGIGFIGFLFFILSLLVSIIGLLMWFFGWIFS